MIEDHIATEARIFCNPELDYSEYLLIRMSLGMYADQLRKRIQSWQDSEVPQFKGCIAESLIAQDSQTLAQVQNLLDNKITLLLPSIAPFATDEKGA